MLGRRLRTPTCPQRCARKVSLTSPSWSPASPAPRLRCTRLRARVCVSWGPCAGQEDLSWQLVVAHRGTTGLGRLEPESEPRLASAFTVLSWAGGLPSLGPASTSGGEKSQQGSESLGLSKMTAGRSLRDRKSFSFRVYYY